VYERHWYRGAPLSAAGLYAIGLLGTPAMLAAVAYVFPAATTLTLTGQLREVRRLVFHEPQPWAAFAVGDGILGVSFLNCWVLFRERSAPRGAAWCAVNTLLGMLGGRRVAQAGGRQAAATMNATRIVCTLTAVRSSRAACT
jgi:hypothetical protein